MDNAIIGNKRPLYFELERDFIEAKEIKILVSFLRESGAKLIAELFKKCGIDSQITLITGSYLNITEPSAIYYLKKEFGNAIDIKFYQKDVISFHPKVYIIEKDDENIIYIGSSNISKAALLNGIEWNYRLRRTVDHESYDKFNQEFINIKNNNSIKITDKILKKYKEKWIKPEYNKSVETFEKIIDQVHKCPEPRGAQIDALYELELAREEGINKGLVIAATGVGKTYLAAFDSKKFDKVLFVAHREEILNQAFNSFKNVRSDDGRFGYFKGNQKENDKDIVFASNQTLGKTEFLNNDYFNKNYFDYIIVDEFHHAAADTYMNIIDYFQPKFLLGLTATPFRADNQDIYKICDDNEIYRVGIKEAINRDLLVPFNYYAIYDSTNYNEITYSNGKYIQKELEKELSTHKRANLIIENYENLGGKRTLAFCATIKHAEYMAKEFSKKGYNVKTVHSNKEYEKYKEKRDVAIKKLENDDIEILFTVDMFNEGVDIPSIDTVLFLRPTESFTIFLQQLGRGLRKHDGKDKLTVLDFIGNYKRAHFIPLLLTGKNPYKIQNRKNKILDFEYPSNCNVNIDFKLINLFKKMEENDPLIEQMKREYFRLKDSLGRRPMRLDIFEGIDIETTQFLKKKYKGYLRFLKSMDELKKEEKEWLDTDIEDFLIELEKTSMSKSYKIPVLKSLVGENNLNIKVNIKDIGKVYYDFYNKNKLHQQDLNNKRHKDWQNWDVEKFKNEALRNPIKYLIKRKYFHYDEINQEFYLFDKAKQYNSKLLNEHIDDIINYRNLNYFARRY